MKKKLIIGNWKMAPIKEAEAKKTFEKIKNGGARLRKTDAVVCPPFIFLSGLAKIATSRCFVGAQDAFYEEEGAHTGEISAKMVAAMKAKYVIAGHSERRAAGETDELVAKKVSGAIQAGLTPVLCVGEQKRDPEGNFYHALEAQISASLGEVSKSDISKIVIAYEPVWAIGKKATGVITPDGLLETSIFIRKVLAGRYGAEEARGITILYGGSVDDANCGDFLKQNGIGGLLVGRASLNAEQFIKILTIAENS